jgi:hypothetical protein
MWKGRSGLARGRVQELGRIPASRQNAFAFRTIGHGLDRGAWKGSPEARGSGNIPELQGVLKRVVKGYQQRGVAVGAKSRGLDISFCRQHNWAKEIALVGLPKPGHFVLATGQHLLTIGVEGQGPNRAFMQEGIAYGGPLVHVP